MGHKKTERSQTLVFKARPRACFHHAENVRQDVRTQSHRGTFHLGWKQTAFLLLGRFRILFAEIYGCQGALAAMAPDGEMPHLTIYSAILRKSSRERSFLPAVKKSEKSNMSDRSDTPTGATDDFTDKRKVAKRVSRFRKSGVCNGSTKDSAGFKLQASCVRSCP